MLFIPFFQQKHKINTPLWCEKTTSRTNIVHNYLTDKNNSTINNHKIENLEQYQSAPVFSVIFFSG